MGQVMEHRWWRAGDGGQVVGAGGGGQVVEDR